MSFQFYTVNLRENQTETEAQTNLGFSFNCWLYFVIMRGWRENLFPFSTPKKQLRN